MAVGFQASNAKVHVGDGFEFLKEHKNAFDVIITDSSDPEGPAESLFQKPYFELLHAALREGGVITTQGCKPPWTFALVTPTHHNTPFSLKLYYLVHARCPFSSRWLTSNRTAENQWLHIELIKNLKKDCKEVFPVAEYAYTTIPTYPSGQIGFMVCCKDANRDVSKPIRSWSKEEEEKLCRYYNKEIHEASFVLPTFARRALSW
jgi:spermidine synthase